MTQQVRGSRVPGLVNLAAAVILAAVLISFALSSRSANPPAIAEFAPQAQNQIKQAPQEQTGGFGSASGSATGARATPSPAPSPAADAILLHCVGDPPRQTEDPQSPPCVASWSGNNGGSTWKGVTGSTINVAVPIPPSYDVYDAGVTPASQPLENYFNKRFELYGRRIHLQPYNPTGGNGQGISSQQADAITIDQAGAFAVVPDDAYVNSGNGSNQFFEDEMARRHIITVINEQSQTLTESHLAANAPYEWTYFAPLDVDEANVSQMICRELNGRPPRWAGAAVAASARRVFGVIHEITPDGSNYEDATLLAGLSECGVQPFVIDYQGSQNGDATMYAGVSTQLHQHGVTTITCLCQGNDLGFFEEAGDEQSYEPEWLINSTLQDMDDEGQLSSEEAPGQTMHRFGLTSANKMLPLPNMPWWWAVSEGDPSANASQYEGSGWYYGANYLYLGLLELVSGIQEAGPNLTPSNFQRGLQRTVFPNPGAGGPPLYQAKVGFAGGSHTMVQDMAPIWWSATAQSTYFNGYSGGRGAWCYLDRGVRFQVGSWPAREPDLFNGPCQ